MLATLRKRSKQHEVLYTKFLTRSSLHEVESMRKAIWAIGLVCCAVFATQTVRAQAVPVSMEYTEVYDFIDELITDGYIVRQTAVRPYTRTQIANMLLEASRRCGLQAAPREGNLSRRGGLQQLPRPALGEGVRGWGSIGMNAFGNFLSFEESVRVK